MRKVDKELLSMKPKYAVIKNLLELESQNSMKNTVLNEIREDLQDCYNKDSSLNLGKVEFMLNRLSGHIDGVCQNALEISNVNYDIKVLTDYLEDSIPN